MHDLAKRTLAIGLLLAVSGGMAHAQWTAYNDHRSGTGTATNVTVYSLGATGAAVGGPVTNFDAGTATTPTVIGVQISGVGTISGINGASLLPRAGTPASNIFSGKVDWNASSLFFAPAPYSGSISVTFTNLAPGRKYNFKGTAIRGNNHGGRWTLVTLSNAASARPAHLTLGGTNSPGIITNGWAPYGSMLRTNWQAAFNSGENRGGDVIAWNDIVPLANNTFSIICSNYRAVVSAGALVPKAGGGTTNVEDNFSYAFSAISLEQVLSPIVITNQPTDARACLGQSASFTVGVSGDLPVYQWRVITNTSPTTRVTNNIPNATNATLTVNNVNWSGTNQYFVVVGNQLSIVTSSPPAKLIAENQRVTIANQPRNQTNAVGSTATFTVGVSPLSSQPVYYRWYRSPIVVSPPPLNNPVSGWSTSPTLSLPNVSMNDVAYYFAVLTNCVNQTNSTMASLSVYYEPIVITSNPQPATVNPGVNVTLGVRATGSAPQYQWYKNNSLMPGQTSSNLVLNNVQESDTGDYHAVVSNAAYATNSTVARVAVLRLPYSLFSYTNKVWSYNQNATDLGVEWRGTNYDYSEWPTGRGVLAVEDNAAIVPLIGTTLSLVSPVNGRRVWTYYFRTTFVLNEDPARCVLRATNLYDDGIVVYLNGREAYRMGMQEGNIIYTTPSQAAIEPTDTYVVTNLAQALLVQGTNLLAVEVHQANTNSSDIDWAMAVDVTFPPPEPLEITNQPVSMTVVEAKPVTFSVGYTGSPAFIQWYKWTTNNPTPQAIPGATGQAYTIPLASSADAGYYYVVLTNWFGRVTSDTVALVVRVDTEPPNLLFADGTANMTNILLSFDEPLYYTATYSPSNRATYTVTNTALVGGNFESLGISNAIWFDATNVLLTTGPRRAGYNYVVTVRMPGVQDASPRHNLATNTAAPVSTLSTLVGWNGYWIMQEPLFADAELVNGGWKTNGFYPNPDNGWSFAPQQAAYINPFNKDTEHPVAWHTETSDFVTYPTHYFLAHFPLNPSPVGVRLRLRHSVEDGAIFYLNGTEICRTNVPQTGVTIDTTAFSSRSVVGMSDYIDVNPQLISVTTNVLAAEAHDFPQTANRRFFAAELTANISSLVTGRVVITRQPTNVTVFEGDPAVFSFSGAGANSFQWRSNNASGNPVPIPGATAPTYTIPQTRLTDNGKVFNASVGSPVNTLITSNALLTVVPDTNRPVLLSAYLTASNVITATFSEALWPENATNFVHYRITNALGAALTITSIQLVGNTAVIRVAAMPPQRYTLVVNEVQDNSTAHNYIATNSAATVGVRDWPLISFDTNTIWRFNQARTDLGDLWYTNITTEPGPANTWSNGASVFEADRGVVRDQIGGLRIGTDLYMGPSNPSQNTPTYYFRKWFWVPPLTNMANANFTLRTLLDDGANFYINGRHVYNLGAANPDTYATWSTRTVGDAAVEGPFPLSPTNLVAGSNCLLAATAKQTSLTSSDIAFGAELMLSIPSQVLRPGGMTNIVDPLPPRLAITLIATNKVRLDWSNSVPFQVQSTTNLTRTPVWQTIVPNARPPVTNTFTPTTRPTDFRLKYP